MYSIYHIEGVKIGVSKNVKRRMKQQGYDTYKILEEHTNVYEVSDREIELQKQYGYKVDTIPYWKTLKNGVTERAIIAKKRNGKLAKESGNLLKASKKAGQHAVVSGQLAKLSENKKKSILQYDRDGNFIKEWDFIKKAGIELGLHATAISRVCKGKFKQTGGYIFKYKED